ncbi:MAG: DUF4846 domain-containing protein [Leptospira sp.]|nr:DUF4846 domain-containing protein [Leptospira sp.]
MIRQFFEFEFIFFANTFTISIQKTSTICSIKIIEYFYIPILLLIISISNSLNAKEINELDLPNGYLRVKYENGSFSQYLQKLPLKSNHSILSHNKVNLSSRYNSLGTIDKELLFSDDLEQCADFTMRLWADFHKDSNKLNDLYLFKYSGDKFYFKNSKLTYQKYLRKSFASSNSYSLKKGAGSINKTQLRPGDLFVQNETGGIGHVSIILDHAKKSNEPDLYLIGFSFMPAQEMHIEKAPNSRGKNGWFTYLGFIEHLLEEYPYGTPVLRRF